MKSRTIVTLGIVLVGLVAAVKFSDRSPAKKSADGAKAGDPVLAIADFNKVASVTIKDGTQTVELVKSAGKWSVASLWNYPGDFDRIGDELNKYAQMRVGEIVRADAKQLKEFGLDPAATVENVPGPAVVTLRDEAKKELAVLKIGEGRGRPSAGGQRSYPDSQYVQAGSGPVALVYEFLNKPGAHGKDWITTQLLNIGADQIDEVDITDRNGASYGLVRKDGAIVAKAKAEKEEVKKEGADAVFGAINYLNLADVAGPAASVTNAFGDKPAKYRAKTKDGVVYQIDLGNPAGQTRYARLNVTFEKPAPPATDTVTNAPVGTNAPVVVNLKKDYDEKIAKTEKTVAEQNALRSPWVYLLEESATMNLSMPREQVIAIPAPPSTNAPAATPSADANPFGAPPAK